MRPKGLLYRFRLSPDNMANKKTVIKKLYQHAYERRQVG